MRTGFAADSSWAGMAVHAQKMAVVKLPDSACAVPNAGLQPRRHAYRTRYWRLRHNFLLVQRKKRGRGDRNPRAFDPRQARDAQRDERSAFS